MAMFRTYRGLTYPEFLSRWPFSWFWKRYMCPRDIHLFDEVQTCLTEDEKKCDSTFEHYLACDVCQTYVEITRIGVKYTDKRVLKRREDLRNKAIAKYEVYP